MEGYHTITHYYDLNALTSQIDSLRTHFEQVRTSVIGTQDSYLERTDMFVTTIKHTFEIINTKMQNFKLNTPQQGRSKRGLIDGLGSVIKFITGNLDAKDSERYDNIVNHLKRNQENLQSQLDSQYSINQAFSQNFNHTMEIVNHNNVQIKRELETLQHMLVGENPHIKATEDFLEHYQISLNLLLNIIQDIETSLTFCELGKLHPSILGSELLLSELDHLMEFYSPKFLNHSGKDLFEIKSHIKVQCYVGTDEIVYFLDVPIVDPRNFDLYYLESLPTRSESEYVTIIPSVRYLLKSQNEVLALRDICPSGPSYYLCPGHLLTDMDAGCESEFLKTSSTQNCDYAKLDIPVNYVTLLYRINQYLLVFPYGDVISITSKFGKELRNLQGIYLVRPSKNLVSYHNQTLFAAHRSTSGTPLLVSNIQFTLSPKQTPKNSIQLKNLDLSAIRSDRWEPIESFSLYKIATPSLWSILLYIMLLIFIVNIVIQYRKHRNSLNVN